MENAGPLKDRGKVEYGNKDYGSVTSEQQLEWNYIDYDSQLFIAVTKYLREMIWGDNGCILIQCFMGPVHYYWFHYYGLVVMQNIITTGSKDILRALLHS